MTDKEIQKLGRRELLQLLLDQAKETEQLRTDLAAAEERAREMDETFQRLRERLDEKDAQIQEMSETYERLRGRLNDKDTEIQELKDTLQDEREGRMSTLSEMGSIAEAALRLNGIFEAAQRAADLYLEKVHEVRPLPQGAVVTEAYIHPAQDTGPMNTPPPRTVVDVEPKAAQPPPPREPIRTESPPPPQEPARTETYRPVEERRSFFRKKRQDNKGKFVLSFGWEQQDQ